MVATINGAIKDFPLDTITKPTMRQIAEATLKQNFGADASLSDVNDEHGPFFKYTVRGAKLYNYSYWPDNKVRHQMYLAENLRAGRELKKNLQSRRTRCHSWLGVQHGDYWKAYEPIPSWVPVL